MRGAAATFFAALTLLAAGGCGVSPETTQRDVPERPAAAPAFGDLEEIDAGGTLRLARRRWDGFETLPRQGQVRPFVTSRRSGPSAACGC